MAVPAASTRGSGGAWRAALSRSGDVRESTLACDASVTGSEDAFGAHCATGPRAGGAGRGSSATTVQSDCGHSTQEEIWKEALPKLRKSLSDGNLLRFGPPFVSAGGSAQGVATYFEATPSRGVLEVRGRRRA